MSSIYTNDIHGDTGCECLHCGSVDDNITSNHTLTNTSSINAHANVLNITLLIRAKNGTKLDAIAFNSPRNFYLCKTWAVGGFIITPLHVQENFAVLIHGHDVVPATSTLLRGGQGERAKGDDDVDVRLKTVWALSIVLPYGVVVNLSLKNGSPRSLSNEFSIGGIYLGDVFVVHFQMKHAQHFFIVFKPRWELQLIFFSNSKFDWGLKRQFRKALDFDFLDDSISLSA